MDLKADKAPPPNPTPSQPASMGRGLVVRSADQGADASPSINSVTSIVIGSKSAQSATRGIVKDLITSSRIQADVDVLW